MLPSLISEVIRAANTLQHLTNHEKRHLLERALFMVLQARTKAGMHAMQATLDPVTNLILVASKVEIIPDDKVAETMLDAADILRQLNIMLDASIARRSG